MHAPAVIDMQPHKSWQKVASRQWPRELRAVTYLCMLWRRVGVPSVCRRTATGLLHGATINHPLPPVLLIFFFSVC